MTGLNAKLDEFRRVQDWATLRADLQAVVAYAEANPGNVTQIRSMWNAARDSGRTLGQRCVIRDEIQDIKAAFDLVRARLVQLGVIQNP
jgi:hypothetical protein